MESVLRALATLIVTFADTFTMAGVSINQLARSAVARTSVVEKKSVTAAALSELDNVNTVANRLAEIRELNATLGEDALTEAQEFIDTYQERNSSVNTVPIHIRRAKAKKPVKTQAKAKE